MDVGELGPDLGDVYIDSMHVHSHLQSVRQKFGDCAQHDALFEELTVHEHLKFYAAVKGIPREITAKEIDSVVKILGLTAFVNSRGGRLSDGKKRKLSLAMAAIRRPAVLFLDESSSGMDPLSKRFMWIIKRLAYARRTIILTTHSMEETEAVSDRVGIMMAGQFKCLGTLQEIKSVFGKGFEMAVHATPPTISHINSISAQLSQKTVQYFSLETAVLKRECVTLCRDRNFNLAKEFEQFGQDSVELNASVLVEWLAEKEACDAAHNFLIG
jgi:ATP-binding cassette subfamily A (ABC1) protein 3